MKELLCAVGATILLLSLPVNAQRPDGLRGTLIVLNKQGHDANFIDLASGERLATLPTGRGPHELVVTDDGRWAISTDYGGGNSLTVFDVKNLRVERTIDLRRYPRPHGILLMPGEQEVIVTSEASSTLIVVNFHTGEIKLAISTRRNSAHMVAVSADGRTAFTSNGGSDTVSVVDVGSSDYVKSIDVPDSPEAITTNKSGSEIWVGSNTDEVVSVISSQDESLVAQWSGFAWPYRILLTNDERYAVVPDLRKNNVRFFNAQSKTELGTLDLPGTRPEGVTLYSDDLTVFLSLSGQNKVLVIDIVKRKVLGEYKTGDSPDGIGYSKLELR